MDGSCGPAGNAAVTVAAGIWIAHEDDPIERVIAYDSSGLGEGPFDYSFSDVLPGEYFIGAFIDDFNVNGELDENEYWGGRPIDYEIMIPMLFEFTEDRLDWDFTIQYLYISEC